MTRSWRNILTVQERCPCTQLACKTRGGGKLQQVCNRSDSKLVVRVSSASRAAGLLRASRVNEERSITGTLTDPLSPHPHPSPTRSPSKAPHLHTLPIQANNLIEAPHAPAGLLEEEREPSAAPRGFN